MTRLNAAPEHKPQSGWVSISWLLAAGFYFLASSVLHNAKYRWMAMVTVFAAILHVFIADLAKLEILYRITSTLILGVVLLVISISYARSRRR